MKTIRIGEAFDIYDGPHASPTKTSEGPVYLGIDAISPDGRIISSELAHLSEEDYRKWCKRVTPRFGDMVFSYEATLGRYALIPQNFKCCLGRRLALIRPKNDLVDIRWLYYYFFSKEWSAYIKNHTVVGSTVNRISVEDFPAFEIPLYPKEEQKRMVSFLEKIDNRISNNQLINDNLHQIGRTLFDQLFLGSNAEKRNSSLSEFISFVSTGLNPRKNFKLKTEGIKYLTVKNLTANGSLDFSNCDFIDEKARQLIHKRSCVQRGDILFASISPLGRCYAIMEEPRDWEINESVFNIRPKCPEYQLFLYYLFISDFFVKTAEHNSSGSVFNGIRISTLLDMKIARPGNERLTEFNRIVIPLMKMINLVDAENQRLSEVRRHFLPLLMNGQIVLGD